MSQLNPMLVSASEPASGSGTSPVTAIEIRAICPLDGCSWQAAKTGFGAVAHEQVNAHMDAVHPADKATHWMRHVIA